MLNGIILATALVVAALALLIALKNRQIKSKEQSDIILALTEEYSRRLNKLEARLVDLQVSLEILESQIGRGRYQSGEDRKTVQNVISQEAKSDVTKSAKVLSDFELSILKCIAEGSKTPTEVRAVVGRSREHVARALKDLYEAGFLYRQGGKPFVYSLSDKGRAVLSDVSSSI